MYLEDINKQDGVKWQVCWVDDYTGEYKKHNICDTPNECMFDIYQWWDKHNFKPPYIRIIDHTDKDYFRIDYGNHYCFYEIIRIGDKGDK